MNCFSVGLNMTSSRSKTGKLPPVSAGEKCGVWIDAAELRTKQQKKRLTQPISKLLNPLARSGGYSTAVALNFTQTKMEIPATKQSTISAFFQPRQKVTEEQCSPQPSEISSTPHPEVHMGTKRKHVETTAASPDEVSSHTSQVPLQQLDADLQNESEENFTDQTKEQNFFHLIWGNVSEKLEPAEKRRLTVDYCSECETEQQKECKKDIFRGIQDIDRSSAFCAAMESPIEENISSQYLTMDKNIPSQRPVLTTRSVVENPGEHMLKHPPKVVELYEQKHHCHYRHTRWSPVKRKDKENSGPTSPPHTTSGSPLTHLLASSPAKRFSNFGKPTIPQKTRHCQSPKKLLKDSLENEQASFAMLFTQDSEGFRVIANHTKQTRWPLKDQTNSAESRDNWNILSRKCLEIEESDSEPEMLFTQDSQGNMVIKH